MNDEKTLKTKKWNLVPGLKVTGVHEEASGVWRDVNQVCTGVEGGRRRVWRKVGSIRIVDERDLIDWLIDWMIFIVHKHFSVCFLKKKNVYNSELIDAITLNLSTELQTNT